MCMCECGLSPSKPLGAVHAGAALCLNAVLHSAPMWLTCCAGCCRSNVATPFPGKIGDGSEPALLSCNADGIHSASSYIGPQVSCTACGAVKTMLCSCIRVLWLEQLVTVFVKA